MASIADTLLNQYNKIGQPYTDTNVSTTNQTDNRTPVQRFVANLTGMVPQIVMMMMMQQYMNPAGSGTPITDSQSSLDPNNAKIQVPPLSSTSMGGSGLSSTSMGGSGLTPLPSGYGVGGGGGGMDVITQILKNLFGGGMMPK